MPDPLKIPHDTPVEELNRILTKYDAENPKRDEEPGWREATEFTFSGCPHTQAQHLLVENPNGTWEVVVCVACGGVIQTECHHSRMEWFANGKVLICRLCGKDGT